MKIIAVQLDNFKKKKQTTLEDLIEVYMVYPFKLPF